MNHRPLEADRQALLAGLADGTVDARERPRAAPCRREGRGVQRRAVRHRRARDDGRARPAVRPGVIGPAGSRAATAGPARSSGSRPAPSPRAAGRSHAALSTASHGRSATFRARGATRRSPAGSCGGAGGTIWVACPSACLRPIPYVGSRRRHRRRRSRAAVLRHHFRRASLVVEKAKSDYVTEADRRTADGDQQLRSRFPDHRIVGEENIQRRTGAGELTAHRSARRHHELRAGAADLAVSIACLEGNRPVAGVILDGGPAPLPRHPGRQHSSMASGSRSPPGAASMARFSPPAIRSAPSAPLDLYLSIFATRTDRPGRSGAAAPPPSTSPTRPPASTTASSCALGLGHRRRRRVEEAGGA